MVPKENASFRGCWQPQQEQRAFLIFVFQHYSSLRNYNAFWIALELFPYPKCLAAVTLKLRCGLQRIKRIHHSTGELICRTEMRSLEGPTESLDEALPRLRTWILTELSVLLASRGFGRGER